MKCCINGGNVIRLLFLSAKLFKFEIQKSGQILCVHKPYFLMPGHICNITTYLSACQLHTQLQLDLSMNNDTLFLLWIS